MKKKILISSIIVVAIIVAMIIGWGLYVEIDIAYKSFEFVIPMINKREEIYNQIPYVENKYWIFTK